MGQNEIPVSNESAKQTTPTRTRSRQSTENNDKQAETADSNAQRRRRQRPQSSEPLETQGNEVNKSNSTSGMDISSEDLNKMNNSSSSKLPEKPKAVETRGSYIFESPTEEKQNQNGLGENENESLDSKAKKTKKNKKTENKNDENLTTDKSSKDVGEPENSSAQAKSAKKAKKSKKNEGDGDVGDLFEVVAPEPKFHSKQTTSSMGAYVCVMDEWDNEPETEKPVKKTKKKKKKDKEVKDEKSGIIIDEERIEQLMKEHKAKKEREAMGITDETTGLLEENNTRNYFETINNLYDKKDVQEPIIIEKRERDSTDLKEAEELFEAIDPK